MEEGLHEGNGNLEGNESDYLCSDDPREYEDSDGDTDEDKEYKICGAYKGNKKSGHAYDPNCKFPLWELGLRFVDHIHFKKAVRKYAIAKVVALTYLKSEPKRLRVRCRENCPWLLFASFDRQAECLVVKTYNHVHTCFRTNKNKLLTCKHIQKVFKDRILADPKMKTSALVTIVRQELGASASYDMCQRAKKVILRDSRGGYVEEYANLRGYAVELMHSNPGSTISIQVHRDIDNNAIFYRMYVCFAALKKGWREGCRPFIGVDGCFLKTFTQGELLVSVGRDGNNQMFPVAWEVVEGERKESWKWFLTKLMEDLNHPSGQGLALMSDQQKGLVPILNDFFAKVEHRMCVRHIYANWHKKWKEANRKIQFWNCVRATYVEDFDDQLKKLEEMGEGSTTELLGIPTKHWSRAYFSGTSKCDVLDNNLAEGFNGWILDTRCYPIINMLEEIRKKVMQRMHVKKTWAAKWPTEISPVAKQKLEKNIDHSSQCRLVWNGHGGFEVTQGEYQHTVDLERLTCTCREWELIGIPFAILFVLCFMIRKILRTTLQSGTPRKHT
ncbi:MUSTANG 7 [Hibiscus trionum]|uniref:MUSTANG 7 n=1 Tax=Hibiscus trionum TaxID=183268 RepID=A0A9W7MHF9_HIBTR|nr:MUSTANG 7 [Hibiscus trionum]